MNNKRDSRSIERLRSGITFLMSNTEGRCVVYEILEQAAVFHSCYSENALDMARREGRREMGLMVLDWVANEAPKEYQLMLKEVHNERAERDRANRNH